MGTSEHCVRDGADPASAVITFELSRRATRLPEYETENRTLVSLSREMADSPGNILQKLVEKALELCRADSAGISLVEDANGSEVFRWHAVAGRYASHVGKAMPRDASPCGTVMDLNARILLTRPGCHYSCLDELLPPIEEALLIPFSDGGEPVGTLWVMSNDPLRKFDAEDARVLENLAKFASAAYHLSRASQATQEADRRKDEFLAVLAHELRNPLAPIQNAVHYLRKRGHLQPDEGQVIDVLGRQVKSMTRMIDDLLDISRISRDKLELRKQRIELAAVVDHAIETSRPAIDGCGHRFAVAIPAKPVWFEGDPARLAQVLSNLLNNAAKYTRAGGSIEFSADFLKNEIVFRVRDNGIGIAPDMLSRIFDPFAQVDSSLERSRGGLGIGLALVKRLVQMHGGTVEASSAGHGAGSEFVVRLPASQQIGVVIDFPVPVRSEHAIEFRKDLRILVVDDNRDSADSLAMLLRLQGYEALTAYDGPTALRIATDTRPQVILQDLGMPGMSGYEVARKLGEQAAALPALLVALSGYGTAEDKQRSREAGFHDHLVKPVDLDTLQGLLTTFRPTSHREVGLLLREHQGPQPA